MASRREFGEHGDLTDGVLKTGEATEAAGNGTCSCQEKDLGLAPL